MPRWTAVAALISLSAVACAVPPPVAKAAAPVLLVGNKGEGTLSFVDLATGAEIGRSPTGKWPHEIAISCGHLPVGLRPISAPVARSTKLNVPSPLLPTSSTGAAALATGGGTAQATADREISAATAVQRGMAFLRPRPYGPPLVRHPLFDERAIGAT